MLIYSTLFSLSWHRICRFVDPITLLDRFRIWIFQRANARHASSLLSHGLFSCLLPSSFCSSASHSLVPLRSSPSAVMVLLLSLRLTLERLSIVRTSLSCRVGSLLLFLFTSRKYFRQEKSRVMLWRPRGPLSSTGFSFFSPSLPRPLAGMTRKA